MTLDTPLPQAEIRRSLKASLWDGFFCSLTVGLAEIYFAPFLLFLGAANLLFGILNTVPQFLGSLSQLATSRIVIWIRSRKKLVLMGTTGQAISLALLLLAPFIDYGRFYFLFIALSLYWISWTLFQPAWQSWLGDLVPEEIRGRYFGGRNRLIQLFTFVALAAGGWLLSHYQKVSSALWGFILLFSLAILTRILSFVFIRRQSDISVNATPVNLLRVSPFSKVFLKSPFGFFALFSAFFSVAVNLIGPYFVAYVLQEIHFTYLQFMILIASLVAGKYFSFPVWGKFIDRQGSRRYLMISSILFSLVPFFWIVSPNFYFLIGVHLYAGAAVAGFELCSFHYLLGETQSQNRTEQMAFFEILEGIAVVTGALLGGLFLYMKPFEGKTFLILLFISGVARTLLCLWFLPRLASVKTPQNP